jgi:N-acetylneuraminic acid mutarotase
MSWADPSGKLWLFGGQGPDATGFFSVLNDLWTFDPASSQWTWVSGSREGYQSGSYGTKGVAAATNVPGARYMAVTWIDSGGRLWLFGGVGIAESAEEGGELNDLWRFDPATSLWTWVAGSRGVLQQAVYGIKGVADPANVPGARSEAVSWIDPQDRLWLFGGRGYNAVEPMNVDLNDLWRFDPATLEWIWLSGNEEGNALGVYGTKGQSDPANVPGGRGGSVSWIDSQGKLWLLGGSGWGTSYEDNIILLNDLWRFDSATLEWTWVHGGNSGEQPGVYGTKGLAALTNTPGSRTLSVSWRDPQGKLWLFGGSGFNAAGQWSDLNDLWRFDPETLEWAWISGSEIGDQIGLYGEKGTPAPANVPGPHTSAVSWCCPHGRLWLFGGHGLDAAGDYGNLNDLWRYTR